METFESILQRVFESKMKESQAKTELRRFFLNHREKLYRIFGDNWKIYASDSSLLILYVTNLYDDEEMSIEHIYVPTNENDAGVFYEKVLDSLLNELRKNNRLAKAINNLLSKFK